MTAALFYDEHLRTWQQHQPVVQWGVINSELYLQSSSVMGGSGPRFKAPFPGPAGNTTGRCWTFTRKDFCTRGKQCRYSHRCTWFGGPHHHRACQSKGQQFAPRSPPIHSPYVRFAGPSAHTTKKWTTYSSPDRSTQSVSRRLQCYKVQIPIIRFYAGVSITIPWTTII